jgi:DNA-binding beta-propeller fold protein YncE
MKSRALFTWSRVLIFISSVSICVFQSKAYGFCVSPGTSYGSTPIGSAQPYSVAFSPDGLYLATANTGSNSVTITSIGANGPSGAISYALSPGSTYPASVAFSPSGEYLATANFSSSDITLFKVTKGGILTGGISYTLPSSSSGPNSLAFSPDSLFLLLLMATQMA